LPDQVLTTSLTGVPGSGHPSIEGSWRIYPMKTRKAMLR
jgi:hypothetical protein